MKAYCVVYTVCGIHYRFRCYAENRRAARRACKEAMLITSKDIVEVYEE